MSTFFLDFTAGNDANDGTTFANRWKTFTSGATAARIAPGDTIRVMASASEQSLGINATWTQDSKTVTLASALTTTITNCETAWTASANVTATADTSGFKEGTHNAKLAIAGAFTTGLAAFFATGTLDLSSRQQVSFWILNSAIVNTGDISLRLCSDVAGVTTVDTIAIPAIASVNQWVAFTVDTGGALGASIKSIALYVDTDLGAGAENIFLDNIIACNASGNANALSLTSLIGKVHNLNWAASTTYAANTIRKPTSPNRNGFRYKVTAGGGGNSGSSEPTWPTEVGTTVVDNALTWTCIGLEDSWYPIQSIDGTTVLIDQINATLSTAGLGYPGDTETVAAYRRETIKFAIVTTTTTIHNDVNDSGTHTSDITFTGGWNTTDMTTQTGETWVSGQNGLGIAFNTPSRSNILLENLNATRCSFGLNLSGGAFNEIRNCHVVGVTVPVNITGYAVKILGGHFALAVFTDGNVTGRLITGNSYMTSNCEFRRLSAHSNLGNASTSGCGIIVGSDSVIDQAECYNNLIAGIITGVSPRYYSGIITRSNGTCGIAVFGNLFGSSLLRLRNCNIQETTQFGSQGGQALEITSGGLLRFYSQDDGQVADTHKITWIDAAAAADYSLIQSATDQRHTASGISWKFRIRNTNRKRKWPVFLHIAHVAVASSGQVTMSIWARRNSTDVKGSMIVRGGQIAGVPNDVTVTAEPSVDTWTQYSLNFTPTQAGVVEVYFNVYDGVGTTNNYWVDDFTVTQA